MERQGLLILVQGLAGSGKSCLIELLQYDFLIEENFASDELEESKNIASLVDNLRCGRRCIVSERKYRSNVERETFLNKVLAGLKGQPVTVRLICFDNNEILANHNCKFRTNKTGDPGGVRHIAQNNDDTKTYDIPSDAIVVRIHRLPGD